MTKRFNSLIETNNKAMNMTLLFTNFSQIEFVLGVHTSGACDKSTFVPN